MFRYCNPDGEKDQNPLSENRWKEKSSTWSIVEGSIQTSKQTQRVAACWSYKKGKVQRLGKGHVI